MWQCYVISFNSSHSAVFQVRCLELKFHIQKNSWILISSFKEAWDVKSELVPYIICRYFSTNHHTLLFPIMCCQWMQVLKTFFFPRHNSLNMNQIFRELITLFMNIQFPILKMLHFSDVLLSNNVHVTHQDLYAWSNMLYL